jgi:poly(A) polymerase
MKKEPAITSPELIIEIEEKIMHELGALADELGVELYAVGGFVRDYLLKRPRKDIDCTVVGDALQFAEDVAKRFKSHAVIYERFRTALVPIGEFHCEFVGTRKEEYDAHSRKPRTSEGTLEDDLQRRDFTINAMAISLNKKTLGKFVDLFGGSEHLEKKLLKTPLDPHTTFSEDPLRMMRAARFASQLEFEIEPDALEAMKAMSERITIISQERVSDELLKILSAPKPSIGIKILYDTGLLKHVFPEVERLAGIDLVQDGSREYRHKDVFLHTLQVVDNVAKMSDNVWLRFATLMHDIAKPKTKRFIEGTGWSFHGHEEIGARWQEKIFRKLKLPMDHLPYVQTLVRMHGRPQALVDGGVTDSAIRRLAVHAGAALEDLFTLCRADITTKNPKLQEKYLKNYETVFKKILDVQERDKLREFQSPVRGIEIMEICDLKPSKHVGYIKMQIEEAILDGIIPNDYDAAKKYLLLKKDEWLVEADNYKAPKKAVGDEL